MRSVTSYAGNTTYAGWGAGADEKKMETPHVRREKDGDNISTQRLPRRIGGDEKKMETM